MNLSSVFKTIAHKQLVAVDLPDLGSNQHELNGVTALKEFFGIDDSTRGTLTWHYFADDEDSISEIGEFTFYDARARSAARTGRSEWRFYYSGHFLSKANVGDWFFLVETSFNKLLALVFENNSGWLRAAQTLFGVAEIRTSFDNIPRENIDRQELQLLQRQIIDELGLEISIPAEANDEAIMLERYGRAFPTTAEMSHFARTQVDADPWRPDEALIRWLDREEELFRALENVIVGERLRDGFTEVDEFITYSLSVQNRRKSRMGYALQNHLTRMFEVHRLRFTPQARTEGNNRPDFIFPGQDKYHDPAFDAGLLVMLGVKSTAKDRWRQVLDEADRISEKHLCTLEAGISTKQTDAMQNRHLTLVVPAELHATYTNNQRATMLTVDRFIDFVRRKQA